MPKAAVVILNWNGASLLEQFLPILTRHTDPAVADLYVADNASGDNSVAFLKENYPGINLIELDKNYGFAEGYNRALRGLGHPYYLLLNSDVEVSQGWLEPLIKCLENDEHIAAVMPKIRSWHNRSQFEHAGAAGGLVDRYGYPFCRGRIFNVVEEDTGQYDSPARIFWASGACLLVRSGLYHSSGGLDAFFFAHMEEIDLCWRLQNMGYRISCCHTSIIYHMGGATLPSKDKRKTYLNFRNNSILLFKNLPGKDLLWIIPVRMVLDLLSAFFFLLKGEFGGFYAVIRAKLWVLIHARSIKRRRRETSKVISRYSTAGLYPRSIVYQFFIRRIRTFGELPL